MFVSEKNSPQSWILKFSEAEYVIKDLGQESRKMQATFLFATRLLILMLTAFIF